MLLITLLMAAAPPERAVPFGLPSPHLDRHPGKQARRSARPDWQAFEATWGDWVARWDPRNGTPRFLLAPGVPLVEADALLDDVAALARVPTGELVLDARIERGDRTFLRYTRSWLGAAVVGDEVLIIAREGRITAVKVRLTPLRLDRRPLPGEVVFVDIDGHGWLATRHTDGPDVVYRDASGGEVYRYDTRHFSDVLVSHEERTVGDDVIESPARNVLVTDEDGTTAYTDADGTHSLTGTLTATLTGPELTVINRSAEISKTGSGDLLLEGGTDMPLSAGTVQHHFHVVWDWLKDRWPDHAWLAEQVTATVEAQGGTCNAYYRSGTITFLPGNNTSCHNFGRIADVVYHEVGHGIHDYIRVSGTFASDVSEGSADYVSATILDDPILAPNARLDGSYIREIDSDKVYPDDATGQVHNDGLIWASFLWNLRESWQGEYGEEAGAEMTDLILLGALEPGPELTDLYEAVLLADDDDTDTTNGTPHDCELVDLLNAHGIGPGSVGVLTFDHTPLDAQASATEGYPVAFDVTTWPTDCAAFDADSVGLRYTTDGDAALSDDWEAITLTRSGDTWSGAIPRQPAGAEVRYYLTASSEDGLQEVTTHGGRTDAVYSFRVGDRDALYCEGFEHGADGWTHAGGLPGEKDTSDTVDDWVIGEATGADDTPASAWDGTLLASTNPDGDYTASNRSHLQGPVWTVDAPGPMFMLSYRRFLTVEDGYYDNARVWLNGEVLWENPSSESGSDAHHIDTDWVLHDVPLDEGGDLQLTWSLEADGGLQYGGWAIDEVCLVQLDDPEGHYRTDDLVATDGEGPVEITWTQPWVIPLSATVLVRSADGWPVGPEDGVIIDVDLTPTPGAARTATDSDAQPGETFYYALFAAGADDADWYEAAVEGENADMGGIPGEDTGEPAGDSGEPVAEDTGGDTGDLPVPDEAPGCGCGGGSAGVLSPLLLLLLARRRRS